MNKKRNDILHDAGQISQGKHLTVLSLIPVLKSNSSADYISPRGQPMTSPSGQHPEYDLTLYPHSSPLWPRTELNPTCFLLFPKDQHHYLHLMDQGMSPGRRNVSRITHISSWKQVPNTAWRRLLCLRHASLLPNLKLLIDYQSLKISLSKSVWWTQRREARTNYTHDKCELSSSLFQMLWFSLQLPKKQTEPPSTISLDHTSKVCPWERIRIHSFY